MGGAFGGIIGSAIKKVDQSSGKLDDQLNAYLQNNEESGPVQNIFQSILQGDGELLINIDEIIAPKYDFTDIAGSGGHQLGGLGQDDDFLLNTIKYYSNMELDLAD